MVGGLILWLLTNWRVGISTFLFFSLICSIYLKVFYYSHLGIQQYPKKRPSPFFNLFREAKQSFSLFRKTLYNSTSEIMFALGFWETFCTSLRYSLSLTWVFEIREVESSILLFKSAIFLFISSKSPPLGISKFFP